MIAFWIAVGFRVSNGEVKACFASVKRELDEVALAAAKPTTPFAPV